MSNSNSILDSFEQTFNVWDEMLDYHKQESKNSLWKRFKVSDIEAHPVVTEVKIDGEDENGAPKKVEKLRPMSIVMSGDATTLNESLQDTSKNTRIALCCKSVTDDGVENFFNYPLRDTALKGLLDRAKINGNSLQRLSTEDLCEVLNKCFALYKNNEALCLVRDEKITACHSGDRRDYSVLPIDALLETLKLELDKKFTNAKFIKGFSDHSITIATFSLEDAKAQLLSDYENKLKKMGQIAMAKNIIPGVKFTTSDTGISCARCSAYLYGYGTAISVGSALQVEHRHEAKVEDFSCEVKQLFSRFGNAIEKLENLLDITITNPISCMERVCKRLKLPKAASLEAVYQFEMANGNTPCTAHDIYIAMQEVVFICRTGDDAVPQSKLFTIEENVCRALELNWDQYDVAKRINW